MLAMIISRNLTISVYNREKKQRGDEVQLQESVLLFLTGLSSKKALFVQSWQAP